MMASPLVIYPELTAVVAPMLFGPVEYYAAVARYGATVIDRDLRYDKRNKAVHRYDIADTRGRLTLTVPVSKPATEREGQRLWADMQVSAHGRWWEVHATALESAYGRTPYFEHYFPKFEALFAARPLAEPEGVVDLCLRADAIVREILGIPAPILGDVSNAVGTRHGASTEAEHSLNTDGGIEYYHSLGGRTMARPYEPSDEIAPIKYHQVRQAELGFIAGLSVLDLIFNVGPEAPLFLR